VLVDAVSTSARVLTIRPVTPLRRLSGPWDAERFIEQVRGDDPELASYADRGAGAWGGQAEL